MFETLFAPRSIALIGASATPGKLGYDILANLVHSDFQGAIYPVNPKATKILEKKVFANVAALPETPDLAVIAVPAEFVLTVLKGCAEKGVTNIVVISAGFKESGPEGAAREAEIRKVIADYNLNLIGPNCLGILNPYADLNASFAENLPRRGNIALVSQSGAMAVAIMDWAEEQGIGFSKVVSLGNKAGVTENELLECLENDPQTQTILLYLESFFEGEKFLRTARRISLKKPIIVFKSGSSEAGAKAVSSHTGSLAGSNAAVRAALQQCGALHAETIDDFFDWARAYSMQPLPAQNRIAIVTNAGGPGVIATDRIAASKWLQLSAFDSETKTKLMANLPVTANMQNPVDVIGDALADRYQKALEVILPDPNVDMALVILTPQIMTEKEQTARLIERFRQEYPQKPLFTSFIGGKNVAFAIRKLAEAGIPNFLSPDRAVRALERMVWLRTWRKQNEHEAFSISESLPNPKLRAAIYDEQKNGNRQLSPELAAALLKAFAIDAPEPLLAQSTEAAVLAAERLGYPVVLKIAADQILHKTDLGGVRLALKDAVEVEKAYSEILENIRKKSPQADIRGILVQKMHHLGREVIVGMKRDPVFGPLLMFGLGGVYVEALRDVAFRLAPLTRTEAAAMIHEVRAIKLLEGVRGEAPADIAALTETILRLSDLALAFPEISEFDINPLRVLPADKGVVALDARFLLQEVTEEA